MEQQNIKEFVVTSPDMMVDVAKAVLSKIASSSSGSVVGLQGDLGAGKTTFMKALLSVVGVVENVSSPTFVIRKSYPVPVGGVLPEKFTHVAHVDAYRLNDHNDVYSTGIQNDADRGDVLLFIEWPERLGEQLYSHKNFLGTVYFEHSSETVRTVRFETKE